MINCKLLLKDYYCHEAIVETYTAFEECPTDRRCCFWCDNLGTCIAPCQLCKPPLSEKHTERENESLRRQLGLVSCEEYGCKAGKS